MKINLYGAVALGSLLAGVGDPALAAAQEQSQGSTDQAAAGIADIVVTARRKEESIVAVPVSVTALSGDQLRAASVTSVLQLDRVAPSLRISPVAGRAETVAFTIRGLTDTSGLISSDPAVGIYFADAIEPRALGLGGGLFDLASVQVLKGPQGTLFGKNLTGGAILITPKAPKLNYFDGYVQGIIGSYSRHELQGAVNIPIGSKVALRLGANIVRRDGYYHNLTTGNDLRSDHGDSYRVSLLVAPTDSFANTTVFDGYKGHFNAGGLVLVYVDPNPPSLPFNSYADRLAALKRQQARSNYDVEQNQDSPHNSYNYGITNTSTLDIGELTLKNIFNYRRTLSNDISEDTTPIVIAIQNASIRAHQYSNESQILGSAFDKRLEFATGVYYFREKGGSTSVIAVFGAPQPRNSTRATNVSKSVFAQADFHITPRLTLTAGGRYTWDSRSVGITTTQSTGVVTFNTDVKKSFSKPTWTLSLNYKPRDGTLLYVTNRRGYRSGGFNGGATSAAQLNVIQPEILTDYEIGAKSEGTIGSIGYRTTIAAFHSNYDQIQRNTLTLIGLDLTRTILNVAKARVNGGELEMTLLPVRGLSFSGFVGYTDAKFTKYINPLNGADLSGLPFAQTAKWTYRVSGNLKLPSPDEKGGRLSVSADYYHSSSVSTTDTPVPAGYNGLGFFAKPYGLVGARVSYDHIAGTGIHAAVFGTNLTNRVYTTASVVIPSPLGYSAFFNGDPRTYGVELGFSF